MHVVHERQGSEQDSSVIWLSEPGREHELIFVLIPGGSVPRGPGPRLLPPRLRGRNPRGGGPRSPSALVAKAGFIWEPTEEDYPVGYYCGVRDPDGNHVEFSFGQPLGPGAEQARSRNDSSELTRTAFESPAAGIAAHGIPQGVHHRRPNPVTFSVGIRN